MSLFQKLFGEKLRPYFPEYVWDNAEDELQNASSAEQYRIGEHLLFIPAVCSGVMFPLIR